MVNTYADIVQRKRLGCSVPIHASVSYNNNNNTTTADDDDKTVVVSSCPFCRVNTDDDAPTKCKEFPDWMKLQLGTLDCEYSKAFFNINFDDCVVQDPLPCSSIVNLLHNKSLPIENIAMLQIDIEGYEYILLQGFFQEIPTEFLPPIIHFEHKVMKEMDDKYPLNNNNNNNNNSSRLQVVTDLLTTKGYVLYDEGEDYLAIRTNEIKKSTVDE